MRYVVDCREQPSENNCTLTIAGANVLSGAFPLIVGAPDATARTYWGTKLETITRPELMARLIGSAEFRRRAGAGSGQLVNSAYKVLLGRSADAGGSLVATVLPSFNKAARRSALRKPPWGVGIWQVAGKLRCSTSR